MDYTVLYYVSQKVILFKNSAVYSNKEGKGGRRKTSFYCHACPRKPGLHPNKYFVIYIKQISTVCYVANRNILYLI
jgi:hypothetical protein